MVQNKNVFPLAIDINNNIYAYNSIRWVPILDEMKRSIFGVGVQGVTGIQGISGIQGATGIGVANDGILTIFHTFLVVGG